MKSENKNTKWRGDDHRDVNLIVQICYSVAGVDGVNRELGAIVIARHCASSSPPYRNVIIAGVHLSSNTAWFGLS